MITHRNAGETMLDYYKREFNLCSERVEHHTYLQSERRRQGYLGAAKFYQYEAARWHKRLTECRDKWQEEKLRFIYGTSILWDELFCRLPVDGEKDWNAIETALRNSTKELTIPLYEFGTKEPIKYLKLLNSSEYGTYINH